MALTSLQACMDSSDWFQGTIHEEAGMDSSSSPSGDILTCTRPLIERRIRPQHEQNPKCPRCDSAHTKFCYYNNYSLTQPRYFCKTCRRYWTKGGTLRNIPVGGGCRKNKKASSKKTSDRAVPNQHHLGGSSLSENPTSLQLSFPNAQFLDHGNFLGNQGDPSNANFMSTRFNMMLENNVPIDFMDNKYEALVGHGELGMVGGFNDINYQGLTTNFGMSHHDAINNGTLMDNSHRLMLPYESIHEHQSTLDVKPNPRLLSLDWNEQVCSEAGKDTFGYLGGLGLWTGLMNGYGSSSTNPLSLN